MAKIKSLCGKCSNGCVDGFTLFTRDNSEKVVQKFSFLKVIRSGIGIVGKTKKNYHIVKCDKLMENGFCESYPQNAPAWCKIKS